MFTLELYARIRRAVMADGLSRRDVKSRPIAALTQFWCSPLSRAVQGRDLVGLGGLKRQNDRSDEDARPVVRQNYAPSR